MNANKITTNGTVINDLGYEKPLTTNINCKYRLPCGWCDKKDCLCTYDPYIPITYFNTLQDLVNVPPSCRNCSSHPSNGGDGFCHCTLGVSGITSEIAGANTTVASNILRDEADKVIPGHNTITPNCTITI